MDELQKAIAGDIVVFSKFNSTKTSDTLSTNEKEPSVKDITFPKPQLFVAIEPLNKNDDEKMSSGLNRLMKKIHLSLGIETLKQGRQYLECKENFILQQLSKN